MCPAQVLTLSIVTLTKSCLKAVDCTYDEALGVSTLDAMPDVVCVDENGRWAIVPQLVPAVTLLIIHLACIPGMLFFSLLRAKQNGPIGKQKFQQRYGWLILKYRPVRASSRLARHSRRLPAPPADGSLCWQGAWYAEFVFLYYRITIAAFSVLVGSSANAMLCLALTALVTAGLLMFVLVVKPFDDGWGHGWGAYARPRRPLMTSADKSQMCSLGATLIASAIGFVCLLLPTRGTVANVLVGIVIAAVAVTPVAVGLYEKYRAPEQVAPEGAVAPVESFENAAFEGEQGAEKAGATNATSLPDESSAQAGQVVPETQAPEDPPGEDDESDDEDALGDSHSDTRDKPGDSSDTESEGLAELDFLDELEDDSEEEDGAVSL
eukprot:COSAG04_NODE_491_length_13463_cov_5.877432_13_plen_380_part_00